MEASVTTREYLVEPVGYLKHILLKMIETLEIALWGTILAVILSIPLAFYGARNYTPNRFAYVASRSTVSLFRAIPELVSALFLVLAYGFGPIAGVLALGVHAAGFLGKFYGEDIENADDKPQEALRAIGANKAKVLWFAVLPQVMPQYIAYTLYILDRNVRMATVVGLVGAGGIGQELKGRYDIYNYGHVGTILLVIFLTVFLLDQISARLRSRYV
jgi:phosphonate transport system permease protein